MDLHSLLQLLCLLDGIKRLNVVSVCRIFTSQISQNWISTKSSVFFIIGIPWGQCQTHYVFLISDSHNNEWSGQGVRNSWLNHNKKCQSHPLHQSNIAGAMTHRPHVALTLIHSYKSNQCLLPIKLTYEYSKVLELCIWSMLCQYLPCNSALSNAFSELCQISCSPCYFSNRFGQRDCQGWKKCFECRRVVNKSDPGMS